MARLTSLVVLTLLSHAVFTPVSRAAEWTRFRGPDGFGVVTGHDVPRKWGAGDIAWRTDLPGAGHSSPCVLGDRVFLTSARPAGGKVERLVLCVDRNSGRVAWARSVGTGPGEKQHAMNSHATATCATDGKRVVAFFGKGGIHCVDVRGRLVWSRRLGEFPGVWGTAASPIIVDGMVIQNCDARGPSSLVALDVRTGRTAWKSDRGSKPRGGWNTPVVIKAGRRRELILNGEHAVRGYDLRSGRELWRCMAFTGRGTPIPAWGGGLLYVICGKAGDAYAVRPGGSGDVTKSHMAWHTPRRGGRDIGSPIYVDGVVFTLNSGGTAIAYDARTGKQLYAQKLGGKYAASPIAIDGTVYVQNEAGEVVVLTPGAPLRVLARSPVGSGGGEIFRSTMAVAGSRLYFRSDKALYCVGK